MTFANTSLFRGADAADLAAVDALAVRRDLLRGDALFTPDNPPKEIWLIELGSIDLIAKDKEVRVASMGSGQVLGEGAFLAGGSHPYKAVARETTRLLAIPNEKLQRLLDERPGLAVVVYRNAARQMAEMLRQMAPMLDRPYV